MTCQPIATEYTNALANHIRQANSDFDSYEWDIDIHVYMYMCICNTRIYKITIIRHAVICLDINYWVNFIMSIIIYNTSDTCGIPQTLN